MPHKTNLHFPDEIQHVEGAKVWQDIHGQLHQTPHQALLIDTLDMCGCGDNDETVAFLLKVTMAGLKSGDHRFIQAVKDLTVEHPKAAADLLLHWLYEDHLIARGDDFDAAWIDAAGVETVENGALPDTSQIPETVEGDIIDLLMHFMIRDRETLSYITQTFLLADLPRAARLELVLLYDRGIIEGSDENPEDVQLTLRGLQIAGMAQKRFGIFANQPSASSTGVAV